MSSEKDREKGWCGGRVLNHAFTKYFFFFFFGQVHKVFLINENGITRYLDFFFYQQDI